MRYLLCNIISFKSHSRYAALTIGDLPISDKFTKRSQDTFNIKNNLLIKFGKK
jgi:hypothetical protein